MHRIFGKKEAVRYLDRQGAYLVPIENGRIGVIQTDRGYFLPGGGLEAGENDMTCIERECMEEAGCRAQVKYKIGSAETYYKAPQIGYFHPVQTYYAGVLSEKVQEPTETGHRLVWVEWEDLKGRMVLEMQNWAIEEGMRLTEGSGL